MGTNAAYLSTGKMANYLGVNIRFLKENKGFIFTKGCHFFIPEGRTNPLWCVTKMEEWVRSEGKKAEDILNRVA